MHLVIVKFLGNDIMAVFPQSAEDAMAAAIATLYEVEQYNHHLRQKNLQCVKVGIGLNTGPQHGMPRLCNTVCNNWQRYTHSVTQPVAQDVHSHIGSNTVYDDITLLVVKKR